MTTGFWDSNGRFVQGATVRTAGAWSTSALELEVAAACARVREADSKAALAELKTLLDTHLVLRNDVAERVWNEETKAWKGEPHLLTPLVELYAEQLFTGD